MEDYIVKMVIMDRCPQNRFGEGADTQLKYFSNTSCYVKLKFTLVIR